MNVDGLLNELVSLSARLNKKSDELNAAITKFNTILEGLSLGIEVSLNDPIIKDPVGETLHLGYYRIGSRWELGVKNFGQPIMDSGNGASSLLSQTREVRAMAIPLIPRLLEELKARAEQLDQKITVGQQSAVSLDGMYEVVRDGEKTYVIRDLLTEDELREFERPPEPEIVAGIRRVRRRIVLT